MAPAKHISFDVARAHCKNEVADSILQLYLNGIEFPDMTLAGATASQQRLSGTGKPHRRWSHMQSRENIFRPTHQDERRWCWHALVVITVVTIDALMVYASYTSLSVLELSFEGSADVQVVRVAGMLTVVAAVAYLTVRDDLALASIYGCLSVTHLAVILATDVQQVALGLRLLFH